MKRVEFIVTIVLALAIVCLVIANMSLVLSNRALQADVQGRAQYIQQTAQLEVLYREIVKALADLSVKNQDADLRALLSAHGITVTVNPPASPPAVPSGAEPGRKGGK